MHGTLVLLLAVALAGCATPPDAPEGITLASLGATDDPFLGDPAAPVQVVAFEAPACSACQYFHHNPWPELRAEYVDEGRVGWTLQQWTIGHAYDDRGNVAMECVYREGGSDAAWPFLDVLYSGPAYTGYNDTQLRERLRDHAAAHGLDETVLLACYDEAETAAEAEADIQAGLENGGQGSPVFFVLGPDGMQIVGAGGLRGALDAALAA